MKRNYVKPQLAVESFQLDAALAASCSQQGYAPLNYNGSAQNNPCGHGTSQDPELRYQYVNYTQCVFDIIPAQFDNADQEDKYCYHGPNGGQTFINS